MPLLVLHRHLHGRPVLGLGSPATLEYDIVLGSVCGLVLGGLLTPERRKKVEWLPWIKLTKYYHLAKLGKVAVSLEEAGCRIS
jgi:hypothetical protein